MNNKIGEIISSNQDNIAPIIGKYLQNKNVLDAGCGNGLNSYFINKRYNASVTLLDIEDNRAEEAKLFPFVKTSLGRLPFKDKEFDVVFMQYVIHHIVPEISLVGVIEELKRVSKLIIVVEEISTDKTNLETALIFDEKVNNLIHPDVVMPVYKYYSDTQLKELFSKTALNLLEEKIVNKGSEETGYIQNKIYVLNSNN